jgi:pimeloyl-ACP methyl ester carboxylesterase
VDELAGVVVFTTQSIHEDSLAIAADIARRPVSLAPGTTCTRETHWVRCEGRFTAIDYRGEGGVVAEVGEAGPDASRRYDLPLTAWLPLDRPGPYGGAALPTLVFGHGLGGDRSQGARLAAYAAPRGVATIAIDAPSHGQHPTADPAATAKLVRVLDFFAITTTPLSFAPLVLRDHFREATYDKLQLVQMLAGGVDLDGDGQIDLDPARLGYLGVSLGGIMGPELLGLAPELRAAVLVVPGARVSSIISDGQQFAPVITLLRPQGSTDGDVARFFPILQTLLERGDGASWAPSLLAAAADRPAGFPAASPHLLVGMVVDDDTVPNASTRVLAQALGVPVVPPVRTPIEGVGQTHPAPVAGNLPDGRTAGLLQFDHIVEDGVTKPATHSNIGDSAVGAEAWLDFIDQYLRTGTPEIVDPYAILGE